MSYRIEYAWTAFRVPAASCGRAEDRFLVAIEGGDNNCWSERKRARSWSVDMIGTFTQVLKRAVYYAGACEGGMLKPLNRPCTPESYIRRIRRVLESSRSEQSSPGRWAPVIRVSEGHPAVSLAKEHGQEIEIEPCTWYGDKMVSLEFRESQIPLFFDFVERFPQLPAWCLAKVYGLPES